MKNIKKIDLSTLDDPTDYLKHSNFIYNQQGQMSFKDKLYLTEWKVNQAEFSSVTYYYNLIGEAFGIDNFKEFYTENWDVFGFSQTLHDTVTDINFSPYHQNQHIEMYYVAAGEFTIKILKDSYTLYKGDVLLINKDINHSDIFDINPLDLFILGLNDEVFDSDFLSVLNNKNLKEFILNNINNEITVSEWLMFNVGSKHKQLTEYLKNIQTELSERESQYKNIVDANLVRSFQVLDSIEITKEGAEVVNSRNLLIFDEVDRFIRSNFATIKLNDLSEHIDFTNDYLSRLIKDVTGLGFSQYLQKIKIEKAKELLKETDQSIKAISLSVGYNNTSHFYEIFKSQTGLTPNEYRITT